MKRQLLASVSVASSVLLYFTCAPADAQLNTTFENMFNDFLAVQLTSETPFGRAFDQSAIHANSVLAPALNDMIAGNVSSFPLTSTVAGIYFDFSAGDPTLITESLGPIYSETAETVGARKLNLGFNFAHYSLGSFRGLPLDDMRFTLTSDDLSGDGTLGDFSVETETIDIFPDLDIDANSFVLFASYGITSRLDIGVAVPIINLSINGEARAVINSTSFLEAGVAINNFNNDFLNPDLETTFPYDESVTGVGDVALKLKYAFLRESAVDMAALVDVRFPTGNEDDFLGTGKTNAKFSWIMSRKQGAFSPHLNLSYDYRGADFESKEFELFAGFDQKLGNKATFVLDIFGEYDLDADKTVLLPGSQEVVFNQSAQGPAQFTRNVDLSNVPESSRDNAWNVSVGMKIAPSTRSLLMFNILAPLNDGGLRSNIVPIVGAAITF
jgi:hypothetical protein